MNVLKSIKVWKASYVVLQMDIFIRFIKMGFMAIFSQIEEIIHEFMSTIHFEVSIIFFSKNRPRGVSMWEQNDDDDDDDDARFAICIFSNIDHMPFCISLYQECRAFKCIRSYYYQCISVASHLAFLRLLLLFNVHKKKMRRWWWSVNKKLHLSWYLTYIKQWNYRLQRYKHTKTCIQINTRESTASERQRERWNDFTKISESHWLQEPSIPLCIRNM